MRLDTVFPTLGIPTIDFIKLDVDGYEVDVIRGALETIRKYRPTFILELCPYAHAQAGRRFEDFLQLLAELGYQLYTEDTLSPLPPDLEKLLRLIPDGGGINAIACVVSPLHRKHSVNDGISQPEIL